MKNQFCLPGIPAGFRDGLELQAESPNERLNEPVTGRLDPTSREATAGSTEKPASQAIVLPVRGKRQKPVSFRFIDLFAGIGGFRVGLQKVGGTCVFTSEWDRWAQQTYRAWHGETPVGDINAVNPADIPDHEVLAAGFPCQPFSIAGVSKKRSLGQADGFRCERQGNLFFRICDIVDVKRPPVLILENVKNLQSHDRGRTWAVIQQELRQRRYAICSQVIDAAGYVPQHRERILIVCFNEDIFGSAPSYRFPVPPRSRPRLGDILEPSPDPKYTLSDHLWKYLQAYAAKHRAAGNGFGYGIADLNGVSRTLSARYYKDGSEILIAQRGCNPRRLTLVEAARLMGYGDIVKSRADIPVSDTQAYRQFGNSVVPLVVEAVGRQVVRVMQRHGLASAPPASPNRKRPGQKTVRPSAAQLQRQLLLSL
jgi:DNA (cytosine-5)-methyltransferase 1